MVFLEWWNFQTNSISDARSGADFKAAMWLLLNSEIKKIEEIYHKKNEVAKQKNSNGREMLLEMVVVFDYYLNKIFLIIFFYLNLFHCFLLFITFKYYILVLSMMFCNDKKFLAEG